MPKNISRLVVKMEAENSKLHKDLDRSNKKLKRFEKEASNAQKASKAMAIGMGALGSAVAAVGLGALIKSQMDYQDALAKSADKIGINSQALSGLRFAAEQTVGSYQGIDEALTKASKRLGEFNASGGGAAARWLEKLNLDTEKLGKLQPDQLFNEYSKAINGLNTRGEKMAATSALMGDESRKFLTLMESGPDSIQGFTKEAEALGIAISRVDAAKIEAANDTMNRVATSTKGLGATFAVELAPYITAAADLMRDFAIQGSGAGDKIAKGLDAIVSGVGFVADAYRGWEVIISGIVNLWAVEISTLATGFAWIDKQITKLMKKIGMDAKPNRSLEIFARNASLAAKDAGESFDELIMKEMPSTQIKRFAADVKESAEKIAQSSADARKKINEMTAPAGVTTPETEEPPTKKLVNDAANDSTEWADAWTSAGNRVAAGIGDAFVETMLTQEKMGDKIKSLMAETTKNMLSFFIELGVKKVAIAALDSLNSKKRMVDAAAEGAAITTAMAPAAATTTLATGGGNSVGALIGVAAVSAAIGGLLAGAFDTGGSIPSGKYGLVGEFGPELISGPTNVTSRSDTMDIFKNAANGGGNTAVVNITVSGDGNNAAKTWRQIKPMIEGEVLRMFHENSRRFA